jgi:hypothetical protein
MVEQESINTTEAKFHSKSIFPRIVLLIFVLLLIFTTINLLALYVLPNLPCREKWGVPKYTGLVKDGEYEFGDNRGFTVWATEACFLDILEESVGLARIKVGYFDNYWRLRSYEARIGGILPQVGLCVHEAGNNKCNLVKPSEATSKMNENDVVTLYIVIEDKEGQSLSLDDQDSSYLNFIDNLKKALLSNKAYPITSNYIQISQVRSN